jgi:AraC-like DNA-binding protein
MRREDIWAPVDQLGEALGFLRMNGAFYCQSDLTAPWGMIFPRLPGSLMFHFVTEGRCWLGVDGVELRELRQGDLAIVPHGEGHRLLSDPGAHAVSLFDLPREDISERYELLRHGGGGASMRVVCGAVRFDHPQARDLVALLPRMICVGASASPHAAWIHSTLEFMAAEARVMRPGGEAVVIRLADILVIQAIRVWLEQNQTVQAGWLGALRDKQIGRALALIHRKPERAWTLVALAQEVAMSRSAFAERFTELVGMPAMHYIARCRMHLAHRHLQERAVGLSELASLVGYQSEAAFSRAFKRVIGVSPGSIAFEASKRDIRHVEEGRRRRQGRDD